MAKTVAQIERQRQAGKATVEVGGRRIPADVYRSLSRTDKAKLRELGAEGFNEYKEQQHAQQLAKFEAENIKLPDGKYISKEEYASLSESNQGLLLELGLDAYNKLKKEQK